MLSNQENGVYVIAEAGVNHNGDKQLACDLIEAAAAAKADAVKFQTFKADALASASAPLAEYQRSDNVEANSQLAMLRGLELPFEWHEELKVLANRNGLDFLTTAFDEASLDFVVGLGVPVLKIPSGELTNLPLVWKSAATGLPMIVSTGMASLGETEAALATIAHAYAHQDEPDSLEAVWKTWAQPDRRKALIGKVSVLHCTSLYPAPPEKVQLSALKSLQSAFGLPVGYSDHTNGSAVSLAAVGMGARVLEKHFTISRELPGPDHSASLEPDELAEFVAGVRCVSSAIGDGVKVPQPEEWDTRTASRKYLVAARDIPADQVLCRDDLAAARTGAGIPASLLWDTVGCRTRRSFAGGEAIEL